MLTVQQLSLHLQGRQLLKQISFTLKGGEALAIVGGSGVGKTLLGKLLAGTIVASEGTITYAMPKVECLFVAQQQDFRSYFSNKSYYQQRYDHNYHDSSPHMSTFIGEVPEASMLYYESLKIGELLTKYMITLSNGEAKRVQLFKAFEQAPDVLILDNPFVGLDTEMRLVLGELLKRFQEMGKLPIVIGPATEIPAFITKVLLLEAGGSYKFGDRYLLDTVGLLSPKAITFDTNAISQIQVLSSASATFENAVVLNKVQLKTNERILVKDLNWVVRRGERWALLGPNGSGKSTLLSLISADNSQVYANDVRVFDLQRGEGESIWDVKRKIGMVSPELHIYFLRESKHAYQAGTLQLEDSARGITAYQVVASGLEERPSAQKTFTYSQQQLIRYWMELLEVYALKDQVFYTLSLGMQRVLLLARALVKNPPLLILDEPCQGLDGDQTARFNQLIDFICLHLDKTLIYVSHYTEQLPQSITHKIFLHDGRYSVEKASI